MQFYCRSERIAYYSLDLSAAIRSLLLQPVRLIFWVACFTYCLNAAEPDALTTCQQVLRLSPSEANEGHEVKLKGVITCYVPGSQLCFMQDQSAGIYVYPTPWPKDLGPGDVVEVTGVTGSGLFSPIVQIASIKV